MAQQFQVPIQLIASGGPYAPLNIPHGNHLTGPTDGDVWTTSTSIYAQINGTTVDLAGGAAAGFDYGKTYSISRGLFF